MRRLLALLLAIGILVASATAVAAQGRGKDGDEGREDEPLVDDDKRAEKDDDADADDGEAEDEKERDRAARQGKAPAAIGEFVTQGSSVTGEHVSFSYTATSILDFRAHNVTLYSLVVEPEDAEDEPRPTRAETEGALFRVRTESYAFRANDNPGAVARVDADGTITITFVDGATLSPDDESGAVRFRVGDIDGTLRGEELVVLGTTVVARDQALLFLDEPRGDFDVHREEIGVAIAKGHVGAEASFNARSDDDEDDDAPAAPGASGNATRRGHEQEVVSYGNVTMTTVKAERGNLTIQIEGHGFDGRVLVLNVDGRMIGADRADKLNITLDNETIDHAASLEDALDPDDDGYSPEYYVVYDPAVQAFQLIVTVPHYSVHTLTVATLVDIIPPSVTVGIIVGVLLVVPMALMLFRRK